ncbi:MAG: hypothetical protein E7381_05590 [Clostridiales bacterium]|nr:hypothetical protein [Clostridiales bacterium]
MVWRNLWLLIERLVFARALLTQGKVNLAFGHRSREAYALTHLAPTKHYQCFALRVARPQPPARG